MRQARVASEYLLPALDTASLKKRIEDTIQYLRVRTKKFDAIAFRGMSGALVAPAVAARLKKNLLMVRKPQENSHSSMKVEGFCETAQRYVIIDDFVSSGNTISEIRKAVTKFESDDSKEHSLVAVVCYAFLEYHDEDQKSALIDAPIWVTGRN